MRGGFIRLSSVTGKRRGTAINSLIERRFRVTAGVAYSQACVIIMVVTIVMPLGGPANERNRGLKQKRKDNVLARIASAPGLCHRDANCT